MKKIIIIIILGFTLVLNSCSNQSIYDSGYDISIADNGYVSMEYNMIDSVIDYMKSGSILEKTITFKSQEGFYKYVTIEHEKNNIVITKWEYEDCYADYNYVKDELEKAEINNDASIMEIILNKHKNASNIKIEQSVNTDKKTLISNLNKNR